MAGKDKSETRRFAVVADRWRRSRERIAANKHLERTYRIVVGVVGGVVLVAGIIAIPYPGPGWLIVFTGLGILASEFEWAHRVLRWVRVRYDAFMTWFGKQSIWIRSLGAIFTCAVVLATLWVLGAIGLFASWVGLEQEWLQGPF
ncbi:MAG: TIGR02611 family protein [Rhodococcus sp.]|nr:TIGR02611 family protein [Rhodococcus sp. (in: high G+C Gram-positive bacteria)]